MDFVLQDSLGYVWAIVKNGNVLEKIGLLLTLTSGLSQHCMKVEGTVIIATNP